MTSIEWLIDKMFRQGYFDGNKPLSITNLDHLQQQAVEMHKEEIKNAWDNRNKDVIKSDGKTAEQYYQETFVGSDDHISDISKNVDVSKQILTKKQVIEILNDIDYHYDLKGDADWLMNEIINRLDNIKDTPELPKQETLYTEEQVREAIRMSRITNTINVIGSGVKLHTYSDNEIIESLKQPKKD